MSRRKRPDNYDLDATYLQAWRKHKKLTLYQVANHMGIDKSAISRIERRLTPYDQIHLQQLRDLYDVTIPDLLFKDPERPERPERPRATDGLTELVRKIERPADIAAVKMFLETMLSR
jgi:transcriptional regulator with XRE-family HTH domain